MNEPPVKWTNDNFEDMCWHDCRVHGIKFYKRSEEYEYDIIFNIDFILEWINAGEQFRFLVAPAKLAFHCANKAKIALTLNYMQCLDIDRIEREGISSDAEKNASYTKYLFSIYFHFQTNPITLEANGFTQTLTSEPVLMDRQSFEDAEEI